ncbi:tetratricopeptide repeat protein [Alteromonas facilis]|uniref:tetratricopeptide repeat protein n=1 Tax=Alteromonas facilis TaxID=2048004 RepID=UPI000C290E70|nr:tetratricopeptide repeat protein [Alteromonas facilis]
MMQRVCLAIICAFLLLSVSFSGQAAKGKKTYAMSLPVFKAVESINQLVDEENEQEALSVLEETLNRSRLSRYEQAQLWYLKGTILYRTKGEAASMPAFSQVLEYEGGIPVFLHMRVLKTLMQLNMVQENYVAARDLGAKLVEVAEVPSSDDWALLAQANYKLGDWNAALSGVFKAREIDQLAGNIPKENLLLLQNAVYFELKQLDNMIETLVLLIKHYPKSTYILYLASIYGQNDRLDKQTVLMESLYEAGKLKESSQLLNLASLYMSEKVPIKAAQLIEQELSSGRLKETQRNFEMLSQAWRLAAEVDESMVALERAASMAEDGELYMRLAYMHYDVAQWREAETVARTALDKGLDPEHLGEAWLLIGMTRYNVNAFDSAIQACEKAAQHSKSRDLAQRWISYISKEQEKYKAMRGES